MGAPVGNRNSARQRLFDQALIRAIKQRDLVDGDGTTLRRIAEKLLDMARNGDMQAMIQVRDTLDGKPAQQIEHTGADSGPLSVVVARFTDLPIDK